MQLHFHHIGGYWMKLVLILALFDTKMYIWSGNMRLRFVPCVNSGEAIDSWLHYVVQYVAL